MKIQFIKYMTYLFKKSNNRKNMLYYLCTITCNLFNNDLIYIISSVYCWFLYGYHFIRLYAYTKY